MNDTEIELECQGSTDPATDLSVTWYRKDAPVDSLNSKRLSVDEFNTLRIDVRNMTDEEREFYISEYQCEVCVLSTE